MFVEQNGCRSAHAHGPPKADVLERGKMEQRCVTRRPYARRGDHRIAIDGCFRRLQVPARMNNVSAPDAFTRRRIETIALGEKVIERSRSRVIDIANRLIARRERRGLPRERPALTDVLDDVAVTYHAH